jgi:hypothetical protein
LILLILLVFLIDFFQQFPKRRKSLEGVSECGSELEPRVWGVVRGSGKGGSGGLTGGSGAVAVG